MADEAAHTCSQVTGTIKHETLGADEAQTSHTETSSVQTLLVHLVVLRCRLTRRFCSGGGGVSMTTRTQSFSNMSGELQDPNVPTDQ